jgi:hypothetical protein
MPYYLYRVECESTGNKNPFLRFPYAPQALPEALRRDEIACYIMQKPIDPKERFYSCTSKSLIWAIWWGMSSQKEVRD